MSSVSPVLPHTFSQHSNHDALINEEPFLCSTILMISSRYHVLPGSGGASKSSYIHERFWKNCQTFIMRIILGQEGSSSRSRTLGSIEALILLSEWHPRSLHFPPETADWDCLMNNKDLDDSYVMPSVESQRSWIKNVVEPANRSDRMSWMLLGCATTLGHELGVFLEDDPPNTAKLDKNRRNRQLRIKKLLYTFVTQLAARLGTSSMLPPSLSRFGAGPSDGSTADERLWHDFMDSWTQLTNFIKSLRDMVFPSEAFTRQLLQGGQYVNILEHFRTLLDSWYKANFRSQSTSTISI